MRKPAITTSPRLTMSRGVGRAWPGRSARPVSPRRRARHAARDRAVYSVLIALGYGAGAALIVFGLILAVTA